MAHFHAEAFALMIAVALMLTCIAVFAANPTASHAGPIALLVA